MRNQIAHALAVMAVFLAGTCLTFAGDNENGDTVPIRPDWIGKIAREIRQSEYEFSAPQPGTFSAPNRAHDLRSLFARDGLHLTSRLLGGAAWELRLQLVRAGREGRLETARPADPDAHGNRLQYVREDITEWYVNDDRGLEQGFTLDRRPGGDVDRPVVLEFQVDGAVKMEETDDGKTIVFRNPSGLPILRYGDLTVTDGTGRTLEARLVTTGRGFRIELRDADAVYPIVVDPLMTSPSWSVEGNQGGAEFGIAVATAGDVNGDGYSDVIVGAQNFDTGVFTNVGKAFVYHGSANGLETTATWTATADLGFARFGAAVATAGDVNNDGYHDVLVGAPNYHGAGDLRGRVYLYLGSPAGLSAATWVQDGSADFDRLGTSVATAGDVNGDGYDDVIVGAMESLGPGRASVWQGNSSGLDTAPAWTVRSDQDFSQFGASVSTAGDLNGDGFSDVAVGAPSYDNGESDEGLVFIYLGSVSGLSTSSLPPLEADQAGAEFGASVANAGDTNGDGYADLIVGAPRYDNGQTDEGTAFVFRGGTTGPGPAADWTVEGNQAGAEFGRSVATAGDIDGDGMADLIVGAPLYDNGQGNEGVAFVYSRLALRDSISTVPVWTGEGNQSGAQFGISVSTGGDVNGDGYGDVVVGAFHYDGGEADEGGAFAFHGSARGLSAKIGWLEQGLQPNARMGTSVSTAGDVNGDGYSDVIVGGPLVDVSCVSLPFLDNGQVLFYQGGPDGLHKRPPANIFQCGDAQTGRQLGFSVANAGDVNGDGYDDIIIGAPDYDGGETDEGKVYVYLGCGSGFPAGIVSWSAQGDQAGAQFGFSVAGAGDVNGDGFADIVIGAPGYETKSKKRDEGAAFVWLGGLSSLADRTGLGDLGTPANADWSAVGQQREARFGSAVGTAGDVNGDRFGDLIVGSPYFDSSGKRRNEGASYLFLGGSTGLASTAAWIAEGGQNGALLGTSVGAAGDVNADGFGDVIVGAPLYDDGQNDEGQALVFHGSATGLETSAAWIGQVDQAGAEFGRAASTAGDVNGDGFSDVIVGAPMFDGMTPNEGRVFAFLGSSTGLATIPSVEIEREGSPQAEGQFGNSVAPAGDVDGDGFGDIVVGEFLHDTGTNVDEGQAYVYYGNGYAGFIGGTGRDRIPRQALSATAGPIAHLGRTAGTGDAFQILAQASSAGGREPVRLEWEVQPLGSPFGTPGGSSGETIWFDPGAPIPGEGSSVGLGGGVANLTLGESYHWRVRIAASSPFFPHSPWLSPSFNGPGEADIRAVDGEVPGQLCATCGICQQTYCSLAGTTCTATDCGPNECCLYTCDGPPCQTTVCPPNICPGTCQ